MSDRVNVVNVHCSARIGLSPPVSMTLDLKHHVHVASSEPSFRWRFIGSEIEITDTRWVHHRPGTVGCCIGAHTINELDICYEVLAFQLVENPFCWANSERPTVNWTFRDVETDTRAYEIALQFHLVSEYANDIKIKMDSHKRNLCDRNLLHNLATHKIKFLAWSVHLTLLKFIHLIGSAKKKST